MRRAFQPCHHRISKRGENLYLRSVALETTLPLSTLARWLWTRIPFSTELDMQIAPTSREQKLNYDECESVLKIKHVTHNTMFVTFKLFYEWHFSQITIQYITLFVPSVFLLVSNNCFPCRLCHVTSFSLLLNSHCRNEWPKTPANQMNGPGGKLTPYLCGDAIWKSPNYVIMSLGIRGGGLHFKRPQWVCLWNKRRKRTLKVINPFNSPAPTPHATVDNTVVPQNRLRRERMPVDCFTGVALWNIYINDKCTIQLKHEAHWGKSISPSPSFCCECNYVVAIIGLCTVWGIWPNKLPYNG